MPALMFPHQKPLVADLALEPVLQNLSYFQKSVRLIEPEIKYCGQEFEIIDITNWGHQEFITIKKGGEVIKWTNEKMLEPLNNKSQTKTYLDKLKNKFKKLWEQRLGREVK